MIAEIQCLPNPPGVDDRRWAHVEAAIAVVAASGLRYEVGPLGTTVEGPPDAVWALLRSVHEACLESGADGVVSVVKVEQARDADRQPTMAELVSPHRG
jgi:uncharacterized protein YqgV (UPF0045/DUF77 family)